MRTVRRSPVTAIHHVWSSHVHLHTCTTVMMLTSAGAPAPDVGMRTRSRAGTSGRRPTLPAAAFAGDRRHADAIIRMRQGPGGAPSSSPFGLLPRSKAAPVDDPRAERSRGPALTAFKVAARPFLVPTPARARTVASPKVARPPTGLIGIAPRLAPIGQRTTSARASTKPVMPALLLRRTPSQRTTLLDGAPGTAAMLKRSPELVWRALVAGTAAALEQGTRGHGRPDAAPQAQQIDPPRSAMPMRPSAPRARDEVQSMLLDPALVDRLADDVIRRVERRIRIERERRGI